MTSSWYDIWAGAIAVKQMCVAQGRSGQVIDVGMLLLLIKLWRWLSSANRLTPMHNVQEKANIKTIGWPANLLVQMVSGGRKPVAQVGGSTAV